MNAGEGLSGWDTDIVVDAVMDVHAQLTNFRDPELLEPVGPDDAPERIQRMLDRLRRTEPRLAVIPGLVEDGFGGGLTDERLQDMRTGALLAVLIIGHCEEAVAHARRSEIARRSGAKPR